MGIFNTNEEKLMKAIDNNDITKFKTILEKAYKKNKILNLNEKEWNGNYPLLFATVANNLEMVQLLMEYANKWEILLDLNGKNKYSGEYPLLKATAQWNNLEMVQLLFKYANEHNIQLVFDENDIEKYIEENKEWGYYKCKSISDVDPKILEMWRNYGKTEEKELLDTVIVKNITKVKTILENANRQNKKLNLKLNEKDEYGNYLLLQATLENNLEIVQLLIEYANKWEIQLKLNEKDKFGKYPLLWATWNNNLEMVQLLMEYANEHNIRLVFDENDIEEHKETWGYVAGYFFEINPKILEMWRDYKNKENEEKRRKEKEEQRKERERIEKERIEAEKKKKEKEERRKRERIEAEKRKREEEEQRKERERIEEERRRKEEEVSKERVKAEKKKKEEEESKERVKAEKKKKEEEEKEIIEAEKREKEEEESKEKVKAEKKKKGKKKQKKEKERVKSEKKKKEEEEQREERERIEAEKRKNEEFIIPPQIQNSVQNQINIDKNEKNEFLCNIKSLIEINDNDYTKISDKYFEWKIKNWNRIQNNGYNHEFIANNHIWNLMMNPNSINDDNEECIDFSLTLCDVADNEFICTNFVIFLRNFYDYRVYDALEYGSSPIFFNKNRSSCGFNDFILKSELYEIFDKYQKPLLENNKIIIGLYIEFYEY